MLAPSRSGEPAAAALGARPRRPDRPGPGGPARPATVPAIPHSALDQPRSLGLVPDGASGSRAPRRSRGWRPEAGGPAWAPRLRDWTWSATSRATTRRSASTAGTRRPGWAVARRPGADPRGAGPAAHRRHQHRPGPVRARARCASVLPVAADAAELLDLTGRWCRERVPQRHAWTQGTHLRAGSARPHRPRRDPRPARGHARLRLPHREVWGVHTRVERRPRVVRRAHARGRVPARRR